MAKAHLRDRSRTAPDQQGQGADQLFERSSGPAFAKSAKVRFWHL